MKQIRPRILLIEPDLYLAKKYQMILEKNNFQVFISSSANDAIHKIDIIKPDLIILELQLRGNNGLEFLHELRSYHDLNDIPVVIYSYLPKSSFMLNKKQALALKISSFLCKTNSTFEDLIINVKQCLPT